ncbi:MAG TPA: asparagine synthetase B [Bacteroidetes bacterium]|nr:asparagine synthetase B [Bacteroidota bacterium]
MLVSLALLPAALPAFASRLLIPMDLTQTDHLRAYGITYNALKAGAKAEWLLNYRGGSFLLEDHREIERLCRLKGVRVERVSEAEVGRIYAEIDEGNMERVHLDKAPRIAVYSPPDAEPWDDAVTLVLEYAEIPYDKVYDEEVLAGRLYDYDWLHLHHEDFTGQYGKFWANYRSADWYIARQANQEALAKKLGFAKVSQLKAAVVVAIRRYVDQGGFLFAMCSATDSYDIAQAALGVDIVEAPFDGDPADPDAQEKLNFDNTFAFQNFQLIPDPSVYEFSTIDATPRSGFSPRGDTGDYFTLFEFSAKYDPVPTMLTQDHTSVIKGFMGQTTAFRVETIKPGVIILGEMEGLGIAKYLHGNSGKGTWTFYGGHDPEDYRHQIGDPPTDLRLHKNSPGYRLILNNILFPAARKKELKT